MLLKFLCAHGSPEILKIQVDSVSLKWNLEILHIQPAPTDADADADAAGPLLS